jgi:hypothetical protein
MHSRCVSYKEYNEYVHYMVKHHLICIVYLKRAVYYPKLQVSAPT